MADPAYIVDGVLTDGEAWVGIATTTLGTGTASVTFTSTDDGQVGDFSQYMDLVIVSYVRGDRGAGETEELFSMLFNGDTAAESQYTMQRLVGYGSSASAQTYTGTGSGTAGWQAYIPCDDDATANVFGAVVTHLFDVNSGKYKSWLSLGASDRSGAGGAQLYAGIYAKQAPISSIKLYGAYGSVMMTGSMFSLFGVLPRMVA